MCVASAVIVYSPKQVYFQLYTIRLLHVLLPRGFYTFHGQSRFLKTHKHYRIYAAHATMDSTLPTSDIESTPPHSPVTMTKPPRASGIVGHQSASVSTGEAGNMTKTTISRYLLGLESPTGTR